MTRTARFVSLAAVVAVLVAPLATVQAQKEGKPTVAILAFENGSFGPSAKDYDGLTKGVPGFLVTEMTSNPNIRVIERGEVQKLVDEQKLAKDGHVDQATAVKIGILLGAQHMIFGTFMIDPKGNFRIDARAVSVETSAIEHVERVDDKADNIMTSISTLAGKLNTGMHLPAMPARRTGDASPAAGAQQSSAPSTVNTATPSATPKLPMRVAVMYGKALDLKDHHENGKALELFNAVLKEFPTYEPANAERAKLKGT
jgi:TolB-like protein